MVVWNYKCALLSATFRGTLFFITNLTAGFEAATTALGVEFALRFVTSGFYGALTQHFSRLQPRWRATAAAVVVLPTLAHTLEFLVHSAAHTPELGTSLAASIAFSMVSTVSTMCAMRHGYLVVGRA